jgi:WD40-like Beta Propeller Repeat
MKSASFLLLVIMIASCSQGASSNGSQASSARSSATPASAAAVDTRLTCGSQSALGDPLALMIKTGASGSELLVVDVVDPINPVVRCDLSPASGGRFVAATRVAFWQADTLFVADILSGSVAETAKLPDIPTDGAFSPDGSLFAYRVGGDTNGLSTHMFVAGQDRTLVVRPGIGGHGGGPFGPATQLQFSADGKYLLSVDSLFARFGSGPPNFLVYDVNGSVVFQSTTAGFGVWATQGSKLYFLATTEQGAIGGDFHSWDAVAGEVPVAQRLSTYFWPTLKPDGRVLVFNSYDSAGLPHLWTLDLGTGVISQLSNGISSRPLFVGRNVIWSMEEKPCQCGPGGASAPDGNVLVYDMQTRRETTAVLVGFPTVNVIDVWLGY